MSGASKDRARTATVAAVLVLGAGAIVAGARLEPRTVSGWSAYVAAAESRMARELRSGDRFLALDFDADATAERQALRRGDVVIQHLDATDAAGRSVPVPSAMIHHWRGAVFVPGITVEALIQQLQNLPPPAQEDVLESRVLERSRDHMKVFLKLQRHRFVTVMYNTEHDVTFHQYDSARATSASASTKIAEIENAGTPDERELPPGEDRGFLWRLNAYWRYEQAPGGVIAECESISLSRGVPSPLRILIDSIIESTAQESMERTLKSFKKAFDRS